MLYSDVIARRHNISKQGLEKFVNETYFPHKTVYSFGKPTKEFCINEDDEQELLEKYHIYDDEQKSLKRSKKK